MLKIRPIQECYSRMAMLRARPGAREGGEQRHARPDARRVWQRPREGRWAAAAFWIAIAIAVELSLHLGFHSYLHFSAHALVPVVLLGCVSVARAVRLCVVWTPLPGRWCALGVNNRIHSLFINV